MINTFKIIQRLPGRPDAVSIPGAMDPDPGARDVGRGPSVMKGETIKFLVPQVPDGSIYKVSVGHTVDNKRPLFEGYALSAVQKDTVMALTALDTRTMDTGMYLWDVFELPEGGTPEMVVCGSLYLKETVGGRWVLDDPTEAMPTGDGAIPTPDGEAPVDPDAGNDILFLKSGQTMEPGRFVNIYDDGGVSKARYADAELSLQAHGFILSATTEGGNVTVYMNGNVTGLSGIATGSTYILGTNGLPTTIPATSGIHQRVGYGGTSTAIYSEIDDPVFL